MIDFCEKYKKDFNEDLRNELRVDTLLSFIISKYLFPNEYMVIGDNFEAKLPDLWFFDRQIGFEFVQCEDDKTYLSKDIWKALKKFNCEYNLTIKELKSKGFPIDEYIFQTYKNKIIFFMRNEIGHKFDYLRSVYEKNIENKLNKLKKGNYDGCKLKYLVISQVEKLRDSTDIKLIKEIYDNLTKKVSVSFDEVFIITTKGIYSIKNNIINIASFIDYEFSACVYDMKILLRFFDELDPLVIEDIQKDLLKQIKTSLNLLHEELNICGALCDHVTCVKIESYKMLITNYLWALLGKGKNDKVSLYKTHRSAVNDFYTLNQSELKDLKTARNKFYSHFDMDYRENCNIISFAFIEKCINFIENTIN